jgi:hypothetical protein
MLLQDTRWTSWIDLCCGQAPFFADAPPGVRCVGVDRNAGQLVAARRHCPHAEFMPMDVLDPAVTRLGRFGVVTLFWGAYSSLGGPEAVETLIDHMHALTSEGGAVYIETLDPTRLGGFNHTAFARANNFKVEMIDEATGRWRYEDDEGVHELCSPPLSFFRSAFAKRDMTTRVATVVQTLSQLVARRTPSPGAYSWAKGRR